MNNKITFVEIVDTIAESTSTSKRVCELFLRELFSTISQALIDGETVKVKGIGTFKVVKVKPRKSVDVSTGEAISISGHSKMSFTPDKSLADAVNQPFAQFESVFLDDAMTDEQLADIDKQYPSLFDEESQQDLEQAKDTDPVQEPEPALEKEPEPEPDPVQESDKPHRMPAMAVPVPDPDSKPDPNPEPDVESHNVVLPVEPSTPAPQEPEPSTPASRPMLVGIPIDGPSQPVPEPEPEEETAADDYFYRPAPRNAYTPTREQLESRPRKHGALQGLGGKQWLGVAIGILIGCLFTWLLMRACDRTEPSMAGKAVVATDTVPFADTVVVDAEKPDVITETVTTQVVLSTLAAKHYGSQWFWVYIYEENKDIIDNPDNVPPGTKVVIPPAEKYGIDAKDPKSIKKAQRRSWEILTLGKR